MLWCEQTAEDLGFEGQKEKPAEGGSGITFLLQKGDTLQVVAAPLCSLPGPEPL